MGHFQWVFFVLISVMVLDECFAVSTLKVHAIVKSNRVNIFEGDAEDLELKKGKIVQALIGSSEDISGAVIAELSHCRNGKNYLLFKRKISAKNSSAKPIPVENVTCQNGFASLFYELDATDICAKGESIEYSFNEVGSGKANTVLGSVFPKITISKFETYVFLREQFKFNPNKAHQDDVGVNHAYLVLTTAFARLLNGQKVEVDYTINGNGSLRSFHNEFFLEDGNHSLDLSQAGHGLQVGDTVTVQYAVAGYKYKRVFTLTKDYSQQVSLVSNKLHYSLELNNLDWYTAEPVHSVFKDLDYNRGGRSIEVSHLVPDFVTGNTFGNYEIHLTLNGYQHLYVNTSVVR